MKLESRVNKSHFARLNPRLELKIENLPIKPRLVRTNQLELVWLNLLALYSPLTGNVADSDHCDPRAVLEGGQLQQKDRGISPPGSSRSLQARDRPKMEMVNIKASSQLCGSNIL